MSTSLSWPGAAPERSAAQRRQALAQANHIRIQRAALKADLKRGAVSIAALIGDPPECLASAKVLELLVALPGYGQTKAAHLLEGCRISPRKSVAGLSERQRREIIRTLAK
jgi:hypothetical protein